jgi:tRNA(Ile)-lysidine synthase
MIESGDRILIAVSGGVDSIVLLRTLFDLRKDLGIELAIAHLDHKMRDDSHKDLEFVQKLGQNLELDCFSEAIDVPALIEGEKRSPEEAARIARYGFLESVAIEWNATKIATAHNCSDSAETFLINLLRGSGIDGLSGLPAVRNLQNFKVIRPLIDCSRAEIEETAESKDWDFRVDPTNSDPKYTRNKIRHQLIPKLLEFNPNLLETLTNTTTNIEKASKFISRLAQQAYDSILISKTTEEISLDKKELISHDDFLVENILRIGIKGLRGNLDGIEKIHLDRALDEIRADQVGNQVPFIKDLSMLIEPGHIRIVQGELEEPFADPYEVQLNLAGTQEFAEIGWSFEIEVTDENNYEANGCLEAQLDFDKIVQPLYLRNRRSGDRLTPLGMGGTKKLQDLFVDAKIPRIERDTIPIICDQDGILWVVGLRMSERGRVAPDTKKLLRLRAVPMNRSEKIDV